MAVTNLIDAIQQKWTAMPSFSGKPAELWFGDIWPTLPAGVTWSDYPFIRFGHLGFDTTTTFEYPPLEDWLFRFEVYGQSVQVVLPIFDQMRFGNANPEAQAGFWYASSIDMPPGYSFKALEPTGRPTVEVRNGQFSPTGTPIHVVSFDMILHVYRVTFA